MIEVHPVLSYRDSLILAPRDLLMDTHVSMTARVVGIWVRDYVGYLTAEIGANALGIPVEAFLSALTELLYSGHLPEGIEDLIPDDAADVHLSVSGELAVQTMLLTMGTEGRE